MALRAFQTLVIVASLVGALVFAASAARMLRTHRTPDAIERAVLEAAARQAHHQPIYADPGRADAPTLLPGYPVAVAALAADPSPGLLEARVTALGAALFAAILVALIVQLECGSWTLAIAAGSFALFAQGLLTLPAGVARPQSLMMALVLLGLLTIRHLPGIAGAAAGALLFAVATFVEPQAAWFAGGAAVSLALERNRRGRVFVLTTGVLVAAGYVWLSHALGPWFNWSAFDGPLSALRFDAYAPLEALADPLLRTFGVWTIAALLSLSMEVEPWSGRTGLWMCVGAAGLLGAIAATQSRQFGPEALVPGILVLSVLGPILAQRVTRHLAAWRDPDRAGGENVVCAATLLQFAAVFIAAPIDRWLPGVIAAWPFR
jgi:hypothetical protein